MRVSTAGAALLAFSLALSPLPLLADEGGQAPPPGPPAGPPQDPPPNDPAAPLPERIDQAIDSGLKWLRGRPFATGCFGSFNVKDGTNYLGGKDTYDFPAGLTALAMYTMLKCGVPPDDPMVRRGFAWLRIHQEVPGTDYEIAALMLAIEAKSDPWKRLKDRERDAKSRLKKGQKLDLGVKLPPEDAAWMKLLAAELVRRRSPKGGWRYGMASRGGPIAPEPGANSDMSSTQLALLALLAAERCGQPQPKEAYSVALDWTLASQEADGPAVVRFQPGASGEDSAVAPVTDRARGWAYVAGGKGQEGTATGAMTGCGLANVSIASAVLRERDAAAFEKRYAARTEKAWWDGLAWLQSRWTVSENPGSPYYRTYYLYCLERVADLHGLHLLGSHDWHTEGARALVDDQQPGGFWKDFTHEPSRFVATCFVLLFLNRSTAAVTEK